MAAVRNDHAEAESLHRESMAAETRAGHDEGISDSLWALAGLAASRGAYARALEFQEAAVAHRRAAGWDSLFPRWDVLYQRFVIAATHLQLGDHASILSAFREVRAVCLVSDYRDAYRSWLVLLAASAASQGDVARAARLFGAVAQAWGAGFYSEAARFPSTFESHRASVREQLGEAAWISLWEQGRSMTLEHAVAYALEEADSEDIYATRRRSNRPSIEL